MENRKKEKKTTFETHLLFDAHIKWLMGFLSLVKTHKALKTLRPADTFGLCLQTPMPVLVRHLLVVFKIAASVVKDLVF